MKTVSSDLQALLATDHFVMADLYTFTLADGTLFRLTSFDVDVVWGGNTFVSSGPLIQRSKCSWKARIQVDTLSITLFPTANDLIQGASWGFPRFGRERSTEPSSPLRGLLSRAPLSP